MDYAEILGDAYTFTKEGVTDHTNRWMKMVLAVLCLGLPFNGYLVRIYRGTKPAPDVDGWGRLFVDGLKLLAIVLVYIIPLVLILLFVFGIMLAATILSNNPDEPGFLAVVLQMLFMLILYIAEFIVAIFLPVAYIRFARTGSFFEAFNFSAMAETIGKIGWLNYIIAVILVGIVIGVPLMILVGGAFFVFLAAAFLFGKNVIILLVLLFAMLIIILLVIPVIGVFHARYLTRVYDSGERPV